MEGVREMRVLAGIHGKTEDRKGSELKEGVYTRKEE